MDELCSVRTTEYHSAMGRSKSGLQSVKGADRKSYMLCDSTNMHSGTGNAIGGNQPVAIQGWGRGKGMNDKKVQGNFGGW